MTDKLTCQSILTILYQCSGYPLAEPSLHVQVNNDLDARAVSSASLAEQLQFCRDRGWIKFDVDDYDVKKWFITDSGNVARRR